MRTDRKSEIEMGDLQIDGNNATDSEKRGLLLVLKNYRNTIAIHIFEMNVTSTTEMDIELREDLCRTLATDLQRENR